MRHWRTSGVAYVRGGGVGDGRYLGSTFVEVRAVVVRFDAAGGFGGVDVECVQVGADIVYGAEALDGLEDCESLGVE